MITKDHLEQFSSEGYFILDEAILHGMLEPLREATDRATRRTRAGEWPHKRSAGEDDIWGVGNLHHPDLGEPIFLEYMASACVLDVVPTMLDVQEKDLQLELVNMLVNPAKRDFEIGWHRDLLRMDLPPEEELRRLRGLQQHGVQWNTALYDEAALYIVPRSHLRAKTSEERDIVFNRSKDPMPEQMAVSLKAGQGVYYNSNLLHRGVYPKSVRRETLHCCLGSVAGAKDRPHVYDSVAWMAQDGFRDLLPARLHPLYDNFLQQKQRYEQLQTQERNA